MTEDEMYRAVISNQTDCDGLFFYGVLSTGIFCRPSCPSKKPLRKHVRFFQSAGEAIEAGFRPCKRCRSDLALYCPMDEIAGTIKQHLDGLYERRAPWREVWREIGLSERWAVGRFKETYGMTPKAYMDSLRFREARRLLVQTDTKVIEIAASVGFGGLSIFNRFFKARTGLSPNAYRKKYR